MMSQWTMTTVLVEQPLALPACLPGQYENRLWGHDQYFSNLLKPVIRGKAPSFPHSPLDSTLSSGKRRHIENCDFLRYILQLRQHKIFKGGTNRHTCRDLQLLDWISLQTNWVKGKVSQQSKFRYKTWQWNEKQSSTALHKWGGLTKPLEKA